MKTGFSVFLAAFVALGASCFGLVYGPLKQLSGAKETTVLQSDAKWPQQRTGEATLGEQVYRANGCAACHTEQVRQDGFAIEVTLATLGTYKPEDFRAFVHSLFIMPELESVTNAIAASLRDWKGDLPKTFLVTADKEIAGKLVQSVTVPGVKAQLRLVAIGPDIARGWGPRRSAAADYLYDQPVQPGGLRAGPDLANIGVRAPDVNWQLGHLYAPKSVVPGSTMPAFRYLFEVRKAGAAPAPEALKLKEGFAPTAGFEVIPTAEARELAAYLLSLRANAPLLEAPFTPVFSGKP